jgi:hypothetical protein
MGEDKKRTVTLALPLASWHCLLPPHGKHEAAMCSSCPNILGLHLLISTVMNTRKFNKRKRGKGPMLDGDVTSAQVVTSQTISETRKDGSTVLKRVWVSLDTPHQNLTAVENPAQMPGFDEEPGDMPSPPTDQTNKYQVSVHTSTTS